MQDKNEKKPYSVSQIENEKPNVSKTPCYLTGYIANSMNGGHNRTIAYKKIMAGERHREYRLRLNMQMLTPKTPTYQKLKCTVRAYFVPNSRVWKNAEAYTAQRGGSAEIKIKEIPNIGGFGVPLANKQNASGNFTWITNLESYRDSFVASYLPRVGNFFAFPSTSGYSLKYPKASVLPLRGRVAIYNDMERNKEYDTKATEYNDDTVSYAEFNSYFNLQNTNSDYFNMRAKKPNNYYTDYRTEIQGFDEELPTNLTANESFIKWANWESKIAEARSQAENAQLNDWDIIAKIRGSKKLSEGKVQLLGEKTFDMNYSAITQNTYNTNENIQEQFQVMGKQGAYSYTEVEFPIYAGIEFIEEGYVHFIANVWADTVFEKGFDRNLLNVTPMDEYRPDLKDEKYDVLKYIEMNSSFFDLTNSQIDQAIGYKRKFSEYFKLPNIISGDLTTSNYYQRKINTSTLESTPLIFNPDEQIESQRSFQFFEEDSMYYFNYDGEEYEKYAWKDYTDLAINGNQAILNTIIADPEGENGYQGINIQGQNQIYFVGMHTCICELPIDNAIVNNFTQWGEH